MRPSSAGSSRISKLLLPFLTCAAISTASPLTGTAVGGGGGGQRCGGYRIDAIGGYLLRNGAGDLGAGIDRSGCRTFRAGRRGMFVSRRGAGRSGARTGGGAGRVRGVRCAGRGILFAGDGGLWRGRRGLAGLIRTIGRSLGVGLAGGRRFGARTLRAGRRRCRNHGCGGRVGGRRLLIRGSIGWSSGGLIGGRRRRGGLRSLSGGGVCGCGRGGVGCVAIRRCGCWGGRADHG